MAELFASGQIVDLILALTLVEALILWLYHRRSGRGPAPADYIGSLLAGAFLMLALRGAITGQSWEWLAIYLLAALAAHLSDLARRWPRR